MYWKNKTPNKFVGLKEALRKTRGSHFERVPRKTKKRPAAMHNFAFFLSFVHESFAFFHRLDWLDFLHFERPFLHAASSPNAIPYDENFDERKMYSLVSIAVKHDGKLDRKSRHSSAPHRHKSDSFQL